MSKHKLKLSLREQLMMFKQFYKLLKAGIPMQESLSILISQTKKPVQKKALDEVLDSLTSGKNFSKSLDIFSNSFSSTIYTSLSIGEQTGTLLKNIKYITEELEAKINLRTKITGALIYPVFVALTTLLLCVFLIDYMFPKIIPLFKSFHTHLPWTTRFLIFLSTALKTYGIYILIFIIISCFFFIVLIKKNKNFLLKIQKMLLKIPVVKNIIIYNALAQITQTLSMLLGSSLSLDLALKKTANIFLPIPYTQALQKISDQVAAGTHLSSSLQEFPNLFPIDLCSMIHVAELSGTLPESLESLSKEYSNSIDNLTKNISGTLEPVLMIVMGSIVGFVALSIITPLYAITQNIK